ncbi:MAG: HemK family protein methyltransferase [Bacteroidetes bacterium]|nr:HemK family protein methyltransferase [Bacteroidota bacterium]
MDPATRTVQQAYRQLLQQLTAIWGQGEARATAIALFEDAFNRQRPADDESLLSQADTLRLEQFTQRLLERDEPLAYLTGVAHFAGLKLAINPSVLIPRPETEEWVYRVRQDWEPIAGPQGSSTLQRKLIRVLEVGTGSGCIALALAHALPGFQVTALDISPEALALAAQNARKLGIAVHLLHGDFLDAAYRGSLPEFDLLLSNPPYIDPRETPELERRVRDFEPHLALFGPAANPLAFYDALAQFARNKVALKNPGEGRHSPHTAVGQQSGQSNPDQPLPMAYLETSALTAAAALARWQRGGMNGKIEKDLSGRDRLLLGWR